LGGSLRLNTGDGPKKWAPHPSYDQQPPQQTQYGDAKVANRDIRVWHGATEMGP
jgi:hypothetical protein